MTTLTLSHHVGDFDTWKPFYDQNGDSRREHGCTSAEVLTSADDRNAITVVMTYPSIEQAQAFLADSSLSEAMKNAGVEGPPEIRILESVESLAYEGAS